MTLGDRIAVLDHGVLQQVGPPEELFRTPRNIFVAGFIGSPAMNLARGRLEPGDEGLDLVSGPYRAPLPPDWAARWPGLVSRVEQAGPDAPHTEIIFGLRPSAFELTEPDGTAGTVSVRAVTVESLGDERNVLFVPPFPREGIASELNEDNEPDRLWTARLAPDAPVRMGGEMTLRPQLSATYFFDPATELAIPTAAQTREAQKGQQRPAGHSPSSPAGHNSPNSPAGHKSPISPAGHVDLTVTTLPSLDQSGAPEAATARR
jgi:multiple sugar transport system ATP-binding protein